MPVAFITACVGMCVPTLLQPFEAFEHRTGLGSKLCAGAFLVIAVPSAISMLIGRGEELGDVFFWIGFPFFAAGVLLNIFKMRKNGAI